MNKELEELIRKKFIDSNLISGDYEIKQINYNRRFGDGGEVIIYKNNEYFGIWWWEFKDEDLIFEEEKDVHYAKIDCYLETAYSYFGIYYTDSKLFQSYKERNDEIVKIVEKEKAEMIAKEIANKIMNGTLKLHFYVNDTDCWPAPWSKIKDRHIELK